MALMDMDTDMVIMVVLSLLTVQPSLPTAQLSTLAMDT
ncbi:unnamed protein product, partial [Allacma fusca]